MYKLVDRIRTRPSSQSGRSHVAYLAFELNVYHFQIVIWLKLTKGPAIVIVTTQNQCLALLNCQTTIKLGIEREARFALTSAICRSSILSIINEHIVR